MKKEDRELIKIIRDDAYYAGYHAALQKQQTISEDELREKENAAFQRGLAHFKRTVRGRLMVLNTSQKDLDFILDNISPDE